MKRSMQANEIRTNIVFEFAVVGDSNVRVVSQDILNLMNQYVDKGVVVRLVGINLKKPTSSPVYLTKHIIDVVCDDVSTVENENSVDTDTEETSLEEEDDQHD